MNLASEKARVCVHLCVCVSDIQICACVVAKVVDSPQDWSQQTV